MERFLALMHDHECLTFDEIRQHANLEYRVTDKSIMDLVGRARILIQKYGVDCDLECREQIVHRILTKPNDPD
jgi:hypothetical protein